MAGRLDSLIRDREGVSDVPVHKKFDGTDPSHLFQQPP
jgi:hypothetical protein